MERGGLQWIWHLPKHFSVLYHDALDLSRVDILNLQLHLMQYAFYKRKDVFAQKIFSVCS